MLKVKRIPNENTYNIFLTLAMTFAILAVVYAFTPNNHCSIYLKNKNYFK